MESNLGIPESRILRVFISSTFRDMQEEREELVKHVFPRLRKRCEDRGVIWGDVDLRWGISEEEKAEGNVLPICLAEIDRCRPYFICLLGERYGWVPGEISENVIKQYPWLKNFQDHSVTDLEITHGVFNNPEGKPQAYFYLRDPRYIDSLPLELRHQFSESPAEEELISLGQVESERRCEERKKSLSALKDRIRASDLVVRDNYSDPLALGELVYKDFCDLIDRLFPEGSDNPADREEIQQDTYAARRKSVYIGNPDYEKKLDSFVLGDDDLLVVTGESGLGKSSLLVNWASRFKENHPEIPLITHHVGASDQSADWPTVIQRLMRLSWTPYAAHHVGSIQSRLPNGGLENIYRMSHIQSEVLRSSFGNFLQRGFGVRTVIVIDGIDQFSDRDFITNLDWLPQVISPNVRLIFSCRPGRVLNSLVERGCSLLTIEPLEKKDRTRFIHEYLAKFGKALSSSETDHIASSSSAANPLYIDALLEELRIYGDYATLKSRIDHYLDARTPTELFVKILDRFETDYEREYPGLVGKAMSLLWASHKGLSEAELLDLLGSQGKPLPHVYWSELFLAAESSLINRSGYLSIEHEYLREAVRLKYLPMKEDQQATHKKLADYFKYEEGACSTRVMEELPWQLQEAGNWQGLFDLLACTDFLEAKWGRTHLLRGGGLFPVELPLWTKDLGCPLELVSYWKEVESRASLRMEDAYQPILANPLAYTGCLLDIDQLFYDTGHSLESCQLRTFLVEHCARIGDRASQARALLLLAASLNQFGDQDQAMLKMREAANIFVELSDPVGEQECRLRLEGMTKTSENILRADNRPGQIEILLRDASSCLERRELDRAFGLLEQAEEICRAFGEKGELARVLDQRSMVYAWQNKPDLALSTNAECETLYREAGDIPGIVNGMQNRAFMLTRIGAMDEAQHYLQKAEDNFRSLKSPKELLPCLIHQATSLYAMKKSKEAFTFMTEAYDLARANGLQQEIEFIKRYLDEIRSQLTFSFKRTQ